MSRVLRALSFCLTAIGGLWRAIGESHEQIKIIFAIIVAGWALFEYGERVAESRVAESLKYIERYQKDAVLAARQEYTKYWLLGEGKTLLSKTRKKEWEQVIHDKTEAVGLEPHILTLMLFYNDVALCAKYGVCDTRTSCRYFGREMDALRNSHRILLKSWEDAYRHSFREEIDYFVTRLCGSQI